MPTFSSRPLNPSPLYSSLRKYPFMTFGLPFLSLVVLSSFALETFTRTRYDLHDQKVTSVSKEEELGMNSKRKRVDIREEYYKLNGLGGLSADSPLDARTPHTDFSGVPALPRRSKRKGGGISMAPVDRDDLENVRVPRPPGVPEWGTIKGGEEAPIKGQRKEDRWV